MASFLIGRRSSQKPPLRLPQITQAIPGGAQVKQGIPNVAMRSMRVQKRQRLFGVLPGELELARGENEKQRAAL